MQIDANNRMPLRLFLIAVYIGLFLLLFPWLPVAIWSAVFLNDPILEYSFVYLLFARGLPFFVIVYPIFLVHGVVTSWLAMRRGKSASLVLLKALYPLFLIVPVLFVVIAFVKQ